MSVKLVINKIKIKFIRWKYWVSWNKWKNSLTVKKSETKIFCLSFCIHRLGMFLRLGIQWNLMYKNSEHDTFELNLIYRSARSFDINKPIKKLSTFSFLTSLGTRQYFFFGFNGGCIFVIKTTDFCKHTFKKWNLIN